MNVGPAEKIFIVDCNGSDVFEVQEKIALREVVVYNIRWEFRPRNGSFVVSEGGPETHLFVLE